MPPRRRLGSAGVPQGNARSRMTGKNATPLIGWHSTDPTLKPWIVAEAERRGITVRELLDEALAEYRVRAELHLAAS